MADVDTTAAPPPQPSAQRRRLGAWGASLITAAGLVLCVLVVITPMAPLTQALFAGVTILFAILFARHAGRLAKFALAAAAIVTSTRYIYWRLTETLNFDSVFEAMLGAGMLAAEGYLWVVLVLNFFQTLWGRNRKPAPLPADETQWPTVDVFIPTYNEPLEVVEPAILAARDLDYPADKLRVYVLDDGRREEFRDFCAAAGVDYITRPDNAHAKAGNLNNALKKTDGELVAVFDCDHVPTRGFLQVTVGWFLKNANMGMLQTPHYFHNRDPFEKNLGGGDGPNEGLLFYGMVQNGNDFWNACFFCGSCAVLRRTALEEIGGVAVETVTEDAHTSLKMQRRGWDTGYIRQPLAAGLATDSLSDHIGQRMRWARGMIQIFRLDNPLIGRGLSAAQRLCYASAMIHFMFPLPRFILLTAPLAFLVLGQHIIVASAWEIMAYALPHLIVATIASTVIQGRHRHPFWAEIYEAALSIHLIRPTIMTFLQPRKGKFNVTSKGGGSEDTYFDWSVLHTHVLVLAALVAAAFYGFASIFTGPMGPDDVATTLLNVFWALVSSLFVLLAIATGLESREMRRESRMTVRLPAAVHLSDGRALAGETEDFSLSGAMIRANRPADAPEADMVVELKSAESPVATPAECVHWEGDLLRVRFNPETIDDRAAYVGAVMGRTDAWRDWDKWPSGTVWGSFKRMGASVGAFTRWWTHEARLGDKLRAGGVAAAAFAIAILGVTLGAPAGAAEGEGDTVSAHADARDVTLSLDDFGVLHPIRLEGLEATRGVSITLRGDEVVTAARFAFRIAYSPNLDPSSSQLTISVNGETVHAIALDPIDGVAERVVFDVSPYLFLPDNDVVFRLSAKPLGHNVGCVDDDAVWAEISNTSQLQLRTSRLALSSDLKHLPMPFFDPRDASELELPFAFAEAPSLETVRAAAVVASYWGVHADYRGARFPVTTGALPAGDAVVFTTPQEPIARVTPERITGPSLAVAPHPDDPDARLLLVMGRTGEELSAAAAALSLGADLLTGQSAQVRAPAVQPRAPYDAPRWIPTDRPVRVGELADPESLQGRGLAPGVLSVNVRTAPDLFAWGDAAAKARIKYRAPAEPWVDVERARLDVLMNDQYLESFGLRENRTRLPLPRHAAPGALQTADVEIPPYLIYGENRLQFYFDLVASDAGACRALPGELRTVIDPTTEIDFSGLHRFTAMPNLAYLAQAGFPFTRMADLSETAFVVPPTYDAPALEALFRLTGLMGAKTGHPALGVAVVAPNQVRRHADRDLVVLGDFANQPLFRSWSEHAPVTLHDRGATIHVDGRPAGLAARFGDVTGLAPARAAVELPTGAMSSVLTSYRSPLSKSRTVVAFMGEDGTGLVRLADAVRSSRDAPNIQGDLITIAGADIASYAVAEPYFIGELPTLTRLRWGLNRHAWASPGLALGAMLLLAWGVYALMRRRAERLDAETDRS